MPYILYDGFEDCAIGVAARFCEDGYRREFVVYYYERCIARLTADGMDEDGAEDFMDYNVLGQFSGEGTPGFLFMRGLPKE